MGGEAASGDGGLSVTGGLPFLFLVVLSDLIEGAIRFRWKRWPIPESVFHFAFGFFVEKLFDTTTGDAHEKNAIHESVDLWAKVDPHIMLYVLLPPILFESATKMNVHVFRQMGKSILILAGPGVLISTGLLYGVLRLPLMSGPDASGEVGRVAWPEELLWAGAAILAATDPVAVVAVLHELRAPPAISHLIEGESLINDGTAYSLYFLAFVALEKTDFTLFFLQTVNGADMSEMQGVLLVLQLAFGGVALGLFVAHLCHWWSHWAKLNATALSTLTICGTYGVFVLAELQFQVSGVLAVVAYGLSWTGSKKFQRSRGVRHAHHEVWALLANISDATIFALSGVLCAARTDGVFEKVIEGKLAGQVGLLYVAIHAIRFIACALLKPILNVTGYGFRWRDAWFLTFAGIRGAVSLSLALILLGDTDESQCRQSTFQTPAYSCFNANQTSCNRAGGNCTWQGEQCVKRLSDTCGRLDLVLYVSAIVLLTTLINGTLAAWVYRKLRIATPNKYRSPLAEHVMHRIEERVKQLITQREQQQKGEIQRTGTLTTIHPEAAWHVLPRRADWDCVRKVTGLRAFSDSDKHKGFFCARGLVGHDESGHKMHMSDAIAHMGGLMRKYLDDIHIRGTLHDQDGADDSISPMADDTIAGDRCAVDGKLEDELISTVRETFDAGTQGENLSDSGGSHRETFDAGTLANHNAYNSGTRHNRHFRMRSRRVSQFSGAFKAHENWDDKMRAMYTTMLQSMKHAFLAQNHAHMLSHKALVLLLECVECGFDVLNHHGRERFVERRPEQGTRPLACMTKELEKRMHSEKSSCFHGGFWKDGFAMRCLTCWFSDNAQNLVRFHRKQLQVQVYSAYIVAFKDAFSVLQDGQTEEVDGDAEEAVSARARQWVRDEVKEQVSKATRELKEVALQDARLVSQIHTIAACTEMAHQLARQLPEPVAQGFLDQRHQARLMSVVEHFREKLDVYVPYQTTTVMDSMQKSIEGLKRRFSSKSSLTQLAASTNVARAANRMRHRSKAAPSDARLGPKKGRHEQRAQSRLASTAADDGSLRLGGSSRFDVMNPMGGPTLERTSSAILQTEESYNEDGYDEGNSEELQSYTSSGSFGHSQV